MPRSVLACLACFATSACALMPRELNLTPLWFHRCDAAGNVLEWDAIWPILHYERTPRGGDDFRIRPLYRRLTEPELLAPELAAVEHQFLCPLGRVRVDEEETSSRLFPLWSWRSRVNDEGERDVDWNLCYLMYAGYSADDRENYFGFLPFFGSIPQFLTYDRFRFFLFPLYVNVDKGGHRHHLLLWPLIGFGTCAEDDHSWFRVLPFYGHDIAPGKWDRRFALWPFLAWSTENIDGDSGPVDSFWFWPFCGWRTGPSISGWSVLWPFFQLTNKQDHFFTLTLFWPFFRYHWNRAEQNLHQWWLWPFVGRVHSDDQRSWTFAWPLVWWREYDDPDVYTDQQWVMPFFWHVAQQHETGAHDDFVKLWPIAHVAGRQDENGVPHTGEWSVLSPWPWSEGNATGMQEAYGWLWELVRGVRRAPDDHAVDVVGRVFTTREREGETTTSMPFLFNYERDRAGNRTLRLFQFLPIPLGGGSAEADSQAPR